MMEVISCTMFLYLPNTTTFISLNTADAPDAQPKKTTPRPSEPLTDVHPLTPPTVPSVHATPVSPLTPQLHTYIRL
jgi:hypothetical protein